MEVAGREDMFLEWASLEPERCQVVRGGFKAGKTVFQSFTGLASDALLRREVEHALTERGWTWQVDLGYPLAATVTCPITARHAEGASTEFPGEALLDAYLAILRTT